MMKELDFLKKNWNWIFLVMILILAFSLRTYHLDYPLIDYHNMKEAHTLMEARHFYEDGLSMTNRNDYQIEFENPTGIHSDNFPLYTWMIALLWKITGINLIVPRILTILFSTISIFLIYLIAKELFKREDIALLSALLATLCPLSIFFGRRIFFDVPALMFALIGVYFFLRWKHSPKTQYLIFFISALVIATLLKAVYLIYLLPIFVIFPFKRIFAGRKAYKRYVLWVIWPVIGLTLFILSNQYTRSIFSRITNPDQLSLFFSKPYWITIYNYAIIDNFTTCGFYFAIFGFFISLFYLKKAENRFLVVGLLSIFPYGFIVGWMLSGHNYYQFPFILFMSILMAYAMIFTVRSVVTHNMKWKTARKFMAGFGVLLIVILMIPSLKVATLRQFDTQFIGLEVAGQFLNRNSLPDEKVFGSGHQDTAFYWYANRLGTPLPSSVEELKRYEDELNFRWIFLYQWGLAQIQLEPELEAYVQDNYHLRQAAIIQNKRLHYVLLEKGGTFNPTNMEQDVQGIPSQSKVYQLSDREIEMVWVST